MSGSIPKEIGKMVNLVSMYIVNCNDSHLECAKLSGTIPEEIGNLKKLQRL